MKGTDKKLNELKTTIWKLFVCMYVILGLSDHVLKVN